MYITDVRVRLLPKKENETGRAAYVSITIDDCFVVNGIRVTSENEEERMYMPSWNRGGRRMNVAHPINDRARKMIEASVMAAFKDALKAENK